LGSAIKDSGFLPSVICLLGTWFFQTPETKSHEYVRAKCEKSRKHGDTLMDSGVSLLLFS
jgi:hypothetical protein